MRLKEILLEILITLKAQQIILGELVDALDETNEQPDQPDYL